MQYQELVSDEVHRPDIHAATLVQPTFVSVYD